MSNGQRIIEGLHEALEHARDDNAFVRVRAADLRALEAENARLHTLALRSFVFLDWMVGEGVCPDNVLNEDPDEVHYDLVIALGVETPDAARAALTKAEGWEDGGSGNTSEPFAMACHVDGCGCDDLGHAKLHDKVAVMCAAAGHRGPWASSMKGAIEAWNSWQRRIDISTDITNELHE